MKVLDLIDLLKDLNPEAEILTEQIYDGTPQRVARVTSADRTRVTRRGCRNAGETYWTDVEPEAICPEHGDADALPVVMLS